MPGEVHNYLLTASLCTAILLVGLLACSVNPRIQSDSRQEPVLRSTLADTLVEIRPPKKFRALPQYRFSFGDEIEIKIFDHPEFSTTVTVRPDGRIGLEKIGELFTLGRTPRQLDSLLTRRYSRIIRRPDATVLVKSFGKRNIYVLGEVATPGAYELDDGMTILRAIAKAGGYTQYARLNSVILMRNEYFRNPIAVRLNLANFPRKPDRARDRVLVANDIVYVPKTVIGELDGFVERFITRFVGPPLDLYLRAIFFTRVIN